MARSAIGIDVGGTKAAGLVVDQGGRVTGEADAPTPADDPDHIMDTLYGLIDALAAAREPPPAAVGLGLAGMVDAGAGALSFAPNLALREVPVRDLVAERTGLPVVVDNDANVAAWGEHRFGAGRGSRHMLLVTVGTGIGGGIVTDGVLYRGAHGFAAEIGHVIVEPGGPLCGCGNRGCWEQMASGQALARLGREAAAADPTSPIARLAAAGPATGRVVWEAARQGDPAAGRIIEEVGRRLGEGIAGLVNILDPQVVVVGGGVADIGDLLLGPARAAFGEAVEAPGHRPEVAIVPAQLGNRAGAIGAAALALEL